jgi:L-fuconolactonase
MTIVDSHCHVSDRWYEPLDSLLFQMDRHGVERAVLVQLLGQFDNSYQQDCFRRHHERLRSVVAVDVAHTGAADDLRRLAEQGAVGIRLRPGDRSPGDDPLAIWRAAAELGLVVSCVGNSAAFSSVDFAELVAALPRLPIVLEHLAAGSSPDMDTPARETRRAALHLARFPNVYLKVPGLGELVARAQLGTFAPIAPVMQAPDALCDALRLFGPGRLMWGSDFPVVSSREGYGNALAWSRQVVDAHAPAALPQVFGRTASTLFFKGFA